MAATCDLGDAFEVSVRCTVLVTCACALVGKKCAEGAERRWDDFLLDASKQLVGAIFAHLLFVGVLGEGGGGESCEERWLRSVLDGSWVVFVEFALLNVVASSLEGALGDTGDFTTGEYRDLAGSLVPAKYGKQLLVWLGCVLVAGLAEAWLLWQFQSELQVLAEILLIVVSWSPGLELAVVGVLTPCFMGFVQVWITDDFLKLGGLPLSEVVAALAAKAWAAVAAARAAERAPLEGTRPLLLAVDGGGGAERGLAASASSFSGGGGSGGGGRVAAAVAHKGVSEAANATGLLSTTSVPSTSACAGGLSPKAWLGASQKREEPKTPPSSLDPELQQALAGMEYQVARALGCSPAAHVEAALPLDIPDDPIFQRVLGTGPAAPQVSVAAETPELEDLKARISEKDALLQRLRNEVRRVEDKAKPDSPVRAPETPSPMQTRAAVEQPASGGSRRDREVVMQAAVASPPPAPRQQQQRQQQPPPRQQQPPPRQQQPSSLASPAQHRQPREPVVADIGNGGGAAGADGQPPWEQNSALLDGKIAALEAKINRLNPSAAGSPAPRQGGFPSSQALGREAAMRQFLDSAGGGRPQF